MSLGLIILCGQWVMIFSTNMLSPGSSRWISLFTMLKRFGWPKHDSLARVLRSDYWVTVSYLFLLFWECIIYQDGRINALYSTPSVYTDAKNAANESWPLKTDDFFPWVLHHLWCLTLFWYYVIEQYASTLIITGMLIVNMRTGPASLLVVQRLKDI